MNTSGTQTLLSMDLGLVAVVFQNSSQCVTTTSQLTQRLLRSMPQSTVSPWSMKKPQLLDALEARNVVVHPSWTVPELRQILLEQMGKDKPAKAENALKGMSKMTLAELIKESEKLEISMPAKPTRGLLMKLIRDAKSTPHDTVVTFGKFRGWMYKELPPNYVKWSIQETEANEGSSDELRRLAAWGKQQKMTHEDKDSQPTDLDTDPEARAVIPPPKIKDLQRSRASSDASWGKVNATTKSRARPRVEEVISDSEFDMDEDGQEMDANAEIRRMEARIAALKKRQSH